MKTVFLGIGTNLGDKEDNLKKALVMIEESIGHIVASSSIYETEPWGFECRHEFLNMVVLVKTDLKPSGLLGRILMTEARMGRLREAKKYSSRIIDIDILLYNKQIIKMVDLVIPHPLMHERRFVLVPLCEIAPEGIHPVFKKTFTKLLEECRDGSRVKIYSKPLSAKL